MRTLLASFAVLMLAACGFQPMYAPPGGGPAIGPVVVQTIPGRSGHVLKTELDRMLGVEAGAGGPPMQLRITLTETANNLGIRIDESASRAELRLVASYILTPPNSEDVIRGSASSVVTYDIPTAAFGEIAAQDDARERAAETLAQRLRAELAIRVAQWRADTGRQAAAPQAQPAAGAQ
ncbi:MAG: LPS assembly lipoprotein LptE [Hyphomonadaceae bacterium]